MRWRIPLVVALALLVVVSCDQTTAPTETSTPALDTPTAQVVYNGWDEGMELTFPACGETNTMYSTDHVVLRETVTPKGGYHFGLPRGNLSLPSPSRRRR